MSKCIECNSPPIQLIPHHRISHNVRTAVISLSGPFNSKLIEHRRYGISVISSQLIPSFKAEAFPYISPLSFAAVAKPADPSVLLQTSALLIFVYLIANFVVPQILSKSMGFDKVDEKEKPTSGAAQNEEKANSPPDKRDFNSTKPR